MTNGLGAGQHLICGRCYLSIFSGPAARRLPGKNRTEDKKYRRRWLDCYSFTPVTFLAEGNKSN